MKNVKSALIQAAAYPAALEAKLPEGAPVVSTMLVETAGRVPVVPDFPMEIPDLPAPPELPEVPVGARTAMEVTPVGGARKPLGKEILS